MTTSAVELLLWRIGETVMAWRGTRPRPTRSSPVPATSLIRSEIRRVCGGSRDSRNTSSSDGTHAETGFNALV